MFREWHCGVHETSPYRECCEDWYPSVNFEECIKRSVLACCCSSKVAIHPSQSSWFPLENFRLAAHPIIPCHSIWSGQVKSTVATPKRCSLLPGAEDVFVNMPLPVWPKSPHSA